MKTSLRLPALLLLTVIAFGCASAPTDGEKPPKHAKRVQVALYGSTPRPATATLDVLDAPPSRPHKDIAMLTCDGENEEEAVMTRAILWKARQIGANAVVRLPPDVRRGGFGIPNGRVYRYQAIVYTPN